MADLEKLLQQQKELGEKIKVERERLAAEEKKRREAAMMALGALLLKKTGAAWTAIDMPALSDTLGEMSDVLAACATHPGRDSQEAYKALRSWERRA